MKLIIDLQQASSAYDLQDGYWKFDASYLSDEQRLAFIKAHDSKEEFEIELRFWEGTKFTASGVVLSLSPTFAFKLSAPYQVGHNAKGLTKVTR